MKGFKGFDKDLCCSPSGNKVQYKVGETVEHKGKPALCSSGLHFCENPMDVLGYYPVGPNRYGEVEADGVTDETHKEDSKRVCSKLLIKVELTLKEMIEASVKFIFEKTKSSPDAAATTGEGANAATTGNYANAATTGKESIAAALGIQSAVKGMKGSWIVCSEWAQDESYNWHIVTVKTTKVDGKRIKADTFYRLAGGKFVEAK